MRHFEGELAGPPGRSQPGRGANWPSDPPYRHVSGGAAILRMPRLMCCVRKAGKISVGGSRCCSLLLLSQHFFVALVATEWLASLGLLRAVHVPPKAGECFWSVANRCVASGEQQPCCCSPGAHFCVGRLPPQATMVRQAITMVRPTIKLSAGCPLSPRTDAFSPPRHCLRHCSFAGREHTAATAFASGLPPPVEAPPPPPSPPPPSLRSRCRCRHRGRRPLP